ncbi:MAG: ubiquinol-cytochrome C chaperone family protein [Pseudomonadota bacterium]
MIMSLFRKDPAIDAGEALYASAVEQARSAPLYVEIGVPDTVEGRFEMITLHVYLVLRCLKGDEPGAKKVGQKLFDAMFQNMDDSLRELGVGDLSVGKKIRKLAENFYGRVASYEDALQSEEDNLAQSLGRNVFLDPDAPGARSLAQYVKNAATAIEGQPVSRIVGGIVQFPVVESAL